jgi:transcriptional regulator with XRE-family HTH domain
MVRGCLALRDWKRRRGFKSLAETADYLQMDNTTVSKLLSGDRVPGLKVALHLERETGIPVGFWEQPVGNSMTEPTETPVSD